MENGASLLFHDYETWGVNPKLDFPVQFAAIRTNEDLEIIGEPINFFSQIPNDYLPNPEAALVTGITPQQSISKGVLETQFAEKIFDIMSFPGTCVVGYNSLNFDDEVTRHLFYRNFLPVYEREYLNNNSRWDIIDLVRATYALRPDALTWCFHEEGVPNFKLENLSESNQIKHENAHDALSDVYATIELAKRIKTNEPRLYDYYFSLRNKNEVANRIAMDQLSPLLYVSGVIGSRQGCTTWILPVCYHPQNNNSIVAIDLSKPIQPLIETEAEDLLALQYSTDKDAVKPGILNVKLNKCPFIAPAKMLTPERAEAIGLDRKACLDNFQHLKDNPQLLAKVKEAFAQSSQAQTDINNVDAMLYSREFPTYEDKKSMRAVRKTTTPLYRELEALFTDPLYKRQLFRFIGRNYPSLFDEGDLQNWQEYRRERLSQGLGCMSIPDYLLAIESLLEANANHPKNITLLKKLYAYAQSI